MKRLYLLVWIAAFAALIALCLTGQTKKHEDSRREKAFYADPSLVDFVRPGLVITINSAKISSGAIGVTYSLADPSGLPLDAAGVLNTPGVVSLADVASYIPRGCPSSRGDRWSC